MTVAGQIGHDRAQIGDRRGAAMAAAAAAALAVLDDELAEGVRWFRSCIDLGLVSARRGWGMLGVVARATLRAYDDFSASLSSTLGPEAFERECQRRGTP
jgi:hypothetical protein